MILDTIEYLIYLLGPLGFILVAILVAILLGGLAGIISYIPENENKE